MGRHYRGYIGYGVTSSMYDYANTLGGIITQYDRNVTLAGSLLTTGGTLIPAASTPDGYDYHVFQTSGSLDISGGSTNCDLMIIAGGGGGGGRLGGGGGAGGYLYLPNVPMGPGNYAVVIGAGGPDLAVGWPNGPGANQQGSDTTLGSYKAWGGGGGSSDNGGTAMHGGSGGGGATNAGGPSKDGLNPTTPSPIITSDFPGESHPYPYTQGYPGGSPGVPAGGGGAGGAGLAYATPCSSCGGPGVVGDIPVPASYGTPGPTPGRWFCGGGGGSGWPGYSNPSGGVGGGGAGGEPGSGTDATANTGGGGGGGPITGGTSGTGGSGICVVRVLA